MPQPPTVPAAAWRRSWRGGRKDLVAALLVVAACAAIAGRGHAVRDPSRDYRAAIARRCPDRHLDRLSPADLRDALDDFETRLSPALRARLSRARVAQCRGVIAGANCDNVGDIAAAGQAGLLPRLAASVCGAFAGCSGQSDCTAAR